jgi:hypothetical protein
MDAGNTPVINVDPFSLVVLRDLGLDSGCLGPTAQGDNSETCDFLMNHANYS